MSDLVASWEVPLCDRIHKIEFEHGTTTGRRVVRLDGETIIKRDWMFKLVGTEVFDIKHPGGETTLAKCEIFINASTGFTYEYILFVNGKQFKKFREKQSRIIRSWNYEKLDKQYKIVLEKDTLDVWVNGEKKEMNSDFAEEGTEMCFTLESSQDTKCCIRTVSSGNKNKGIIYVLYIDDVEIAECSI